MMDLKEEYKNIKKTNFKQKKQITLKISGFTLRKRAYN